MSEHHVDYMNRKGVHSVKASFIYTICTLVSSISLLVSEGKWLNRGYQWLQEVWILKLGGGGGKIEGRHILIIAMSEHHVDYMNRKGVHSVIMQGGGGGLFTDVYIR